jgi:hypothetical protein
MVERRQTAYCGRGHRKTWNSGKGWYCWACEDRARQEACAHVFGDRRFAGILGWRCYCSRCGEMYTGVLTEDGWPMESVVAS